MSSAKILVIEDDRSIVQTISLAAGVRWPEAEVISTRLGEMGIEVVEREAPDIVILDLGLPDTDGFDVLRRIRLFSAVPVIILTVSGEEDDIVRGLEWGADDYLVKPFRQTELLARLRALIRRHRPPDHAPVLVCGALRFHPSGRQLFLDGTEIGITPIEGNIVHHLMKNAGRVATYSSLAEAVWGDDYPGTTDSLKVHIARLRRKIEADPGQPRLILTRPGIGYLVAKPGET
jgi:DNA-binding response OmpR family regulator